MNCDRCHTQLSPGFHNTEELCLHYLGISARLNKLNCVNCQICIYLKSKSDQWIHVETVWMGREVRKNGWGTIEAPEELVKFYILSQIVYNETEGGFDRGKVLFDFPDETDVVKILWENGNAIGFYTVKRKESIVFGTMETYDMTTLDTAYILKSHRRKGHGVSILQDLVKTFPGEDIAISTPISTSMCYVILKFLSIYPNYKTKLWEISGVGSEVCAQSLGKEAATSEVKYLVKKIPKMLELV